MIPYIHIPPLDLGFVKIYAFGVLVGFAILVGFFSTKRRAGKVGLDPEEAHTMAIWVIAAAFFVAHAEAMIFDYPQQLMENPWNLLLSLTPISSMGGFLGAFIALLVYTKKRGLSFLAYADVFVWGIVLAWVFGRLGCTLAHDHPGSLSNFFLAVKYPGGSRHDLGFYEFLYTLLVLYPVTRILGRKPRPNGFFLVIVPLMYAPIRFVFDFLRSKHYGNVDPRYFALTAAQWFCMAMVAGGLFALYKMRHAAQTHGPTQDTPEPQEPQDEHDTEDQDAKDTTG